ncbi:hypothetical protein Syun_013961 [Stephania yunnanensis]|uniref:DNA repair metallo-beta-lactamase domain-containing protein n=1 Tax=Stephania yunnanensis TaxID=152371 RepID=A0AAP0JIE1_9MAGN
MPIEMPKGLPMSVDTWGSSSNRKRHHFLTHAHKDHTFGISSPHLSSPIYCTQITQNLLLHQFPQIDRSLFVGIEVGESLAVDDPDGGFAVTAFDANHCPGAVMFLFEGTFGSILHTGDCRLSPECLQNLPEKYLGKKGREPKCSLDFVFLDCTFGKSSVKLPSKYSATRQVISCIWKHPNASKVYLACDLLGQEDILVEVAKTFGSKIYVDKNIECYNNLKLLAPDILSEDPSSRFHLFDGFPRLYERASEKLAEAKANLQPQPLFVRPSAQWYACEETSDDDLQLRKRLNEAVQDSFGVWHVCYSIHSSREELEWALQLLQPKRVVSTTPTCRAMELSYVKNHCLKSQIASDDRLWKLLKIDVEVESSSKAASTNSSEKVATDETAASPRMEIPATPVKPKPLQPKDLPTNYMESLQSLSPPGKTSRVTLFGRARMGLHDSNFSDAENNTLIIVTEPPRDLNFEKTVEKQSTMQAEGTVKLQLEKSEESIDFVKGTSHSCGGSPEKSYNDCLKRLYRSRNIPVPRPLPSLIELLNDTKRAKRGYLK